MSYLYCLICITNGKGDVSSSITFVVVAVGVIVVTVAIVVAAVAMVIIPGYDEDHHHLNQMNN